MVKIGLVSIDVSHPLGFAEELEKYCMDMKYEFLCKESFRDDGEAEWFKKRFGISEIVNNIEDMADKCDIGFIQSCNWEKHLEQALPFIEKGKPVFIDKPIVGSVKDIEKLRGLVKNGADIYGSSSARYCDEVQSFLALPAEQKGNIISVFGTCGVDDFNYGIHITEILSELAGAKIVRSKFVGKTNTEIPCEIYNVEFENGIMGTYHIAIGKWQPFRITVMTDKGVHNLNINSGNLYVSLLREIYRKFTGQKNHITDVETLINCTQAMLCAKKSRDSENGGWVSICDLCENDKFDGYEFEKGYGAKATAIYKD